MTTNSRTGRKRSVDCAAVFALALERARGPLLPCVSAEPARAEASELLSRLGRARKLPAQVPPT